jgi:ABC-type glycerol-3-phosphate transport system substrate-binding protein
MQSRLEFFWIKQYNYKKHRKEQKIGGIDMKSKAKVMAVLLAALMLAMAMVGCSTSGTSGSSGNTAEDSNASPSAVEETQAATDAADEGETQNETLDLKELKQGDDVSIVGQVASSGLATDGTLWVQVEQGDGSFVVFHCQMKQEFEEEADALKMLSAAKIKGAFLNVTEFEQANTSTLVTLYDCEIAG